MPVTPFHFGPGAAFHSIAPKQVSFLAFCAANVLVDIEPLYYMLTQQFPLHRFFHTYLGVTIVIAATVALFQMAIWSATKLPLPDAFGWQRLKVWQVTIGAALGGYSHIVLDSVMHADIKPLAPFSDDNALFRVISLTTLHWLCIGCALLGFIVVGVRKSVRAEGADE